MITKIEGEKYYFEVLEFQSNTSIGVISIKNLCNHNRAKQGYLEKRLDEDRMSGEWENKIILTT